MLVDRTQAGVVVVVVVDDVEAGGPIIERLFAGVIVLERFLAEASTFAFACFGSFELTLFRNGCRLMAFCRRFAFLRFVTSSSGPDEEEEEGGRARSSIGPPAATLVVEPPRNDRIENRSEGRPARGRGGGCTVEASESLRVETRAWVVVAAA